jgi:hypothetical protein
MHLKIGKRLPGVQNGAHVINTTESLDFLVVNTPGGSRLLSVFGTSIRTGIQKNLLVKIRPGSEGCPVY